MLSNSETLSTAVSDTSDLFVPTPAFGNDNPTVSFNLTPVSDYSTQMPFLDIAKTMRPWIGHEAGKWGGMSIDELEAGGYLDENGWVTEIPEGLDSVGSIWAWDGSSTSTSSSAVESRAGIYEMTYEGEGEIQLGNATIISQEDGRIVFEVVDNKNLTFKIFETDPAGTGDYIRNISVVHEDNIDLHEAGAIFNPDWLELVADSRDFRFMFWNSTINSESSSWDERRQVDSATWFGEVPLEIMVQLANEAGVDPWFTIPHMADDEYVREFATYVRDNLDPSLTVRVEYSNEIWNSIYDETHWLKDQAAQEWGDTSGSAHIDYGVMMATKVALIWEEVFAETTETSELVNVIATQTANPWITSRLISGDGWKANDPDGFVDPSSVFEELGVTTYFGSKIVSTEETRLELISAIEDPGIDAAAWLTERLLDPAQKSSLPDALATLLENKAIADEHGLDMVAYEGGQHVHHIDGVSSLTSEQIGAMTNFLIEYARGPEMAMLYEELWNGWSEMSDGAFMMLKDVQAPSKYGTQFLANLDDSSPVSDFILDQMENGGGAEPNSAYLQGITYSGTDAADMMIGSDEEDYLAGGNGDDQFVVGAGNDGINGGDGVDSLLLEDTPGHYAIRVQGDGHLISGPKGDKFVINVETFVFQDGTTLSLSEIIDRLPETLPETPLVQPADPVDEPADPLDEPDQTPDDQPQSSPIELDLEGAIHDAEGVHEAVVTADTSGVHIEAINEWSTLGRELHLGSDAGSQGAYAVYERGSSIETVNVDGTVETIAANYWSVQQNSTGKNEAQISDSAVETVLQFGDLVIDPTAVHATDGNDKFQGGGQDDTVFGESGNDYLNGRGGDDNLYGGQGNDVLIGGAGADTFYLTAGDGQDRIQDFDVEDMLILTDYLADGDTLADAATLNSDGNLVLSNGTDQVILEGLDLDDLSWIRFDQPQSSPIELDLEGAIHDAEGVHEAVVTADTSGVHIEAINEWSTLGRELHLGSDAGSQGAYAVYERGSSIETVNVDGTVETIAANYWSVQQNSTGKNEAQISDSAVETVLQFGDLVIDPTAVHATDGNDKFQGGGQDDTVFGESGNDYLNGRGGDDNLYGGQGNDVLIGGAGADTFYLTAGDGQDRIQDFDVEDMLILTDYLADGDTLADAATLNSDGNLVLSNGTDQVTLEGLDLDDLSWIGF